MKLKLKKVASGGREAPDYLASRYFQNREDNPSATADLSRENGHQGPHGPRSPFSLSFKRTFQTAKTNYAYRLVFACMILVAAGNSLSAQQISAQQAPAEFRIFYLKHANAHEAAKVVERIHVATDAKETRIIPDNRLNALLVNAPPQVVQEIAKIVETLDIPQPTDERHTRVFRLVNIKPDMTLMGILSTAVNNQASVSIDQQRGFVVASGAPNSLNIIRQLLLRLDQQPDRNRRTTEEPMAELRVRLVWLVAGLDSESADAVPADLANVTRELAKIGITDLKMAAQFVVNTSKGHVFTTSGTAKLSEPYHIEVFGAVSDSGRIDLFQDSGRSTRFRRNQHASASKTPGSYETSESSSKRPKLQLAIWAASQDGEPPPVRLETTIKAPIGQSVVLGVTMIESVTSVFVVQIRQSNAPTGTTN